MNVQGICSYDKQIRWLSAMSVGASHDSTAWHMSPLAAKMEAGALAPQFWIAGDDAYSSCSDQIVTPWAGRNLPEDKDVFNYFLR
jgi:hypothetical protein